MLRTVLKLTGITVVLASIACVAFPGVRMLFKATGNSINEAAKERIDLSEAKKLLDQAIVRASEDQMRLNRKVYEVNHQIEASQERLANAKAEKEKNLSFAAKGTEILKANPGKKLVPWGDGQKEAAIVNQSVLERLAKCKVLDETIKTEESLLRNLEQANADGISVMAKVRDDMRRLKEEADRKEVQANATLAINRVKALQTSISASSDQISKDLAEASALFNGKVDVINADHAFYNTGGGGAITISDAEYNKLAGVAGESAVDVFDAYATKAKAATTALGEVASAPEKDVK